MVKGFALYSPIRITGIFEDANSNFNSGRSIASNFSLAKFRENEY